MWKHLLLVLSSLRKVGQKEAKADMQPGPEVSPAPSWFSLAHQALAFISKSSHDHATLWAAIWKN